MTDLHDGAVRTPAVPATTSNGDSRGAVTIRPGDVQYESLRRRYNSRFVAAPEYVRMVKTTREVVGAVQDAVLAGHRVVARSGGHCFENFTADPDVTVLIDLSEMTGVSYDEGHDAVVVEAGAQLGRVYHTIFALWGVTMPAGLCPTVGAAGHILGGGHGPLSRRLGCMADYVHAVEVVVVDADGTARAILATRHADDPHRDLWWAHTGGAGGNFGVVTRIFLRAPDAGRGPSKALPPALSEKLVRVLTWAPGVLGEEEFCRVLANVGAWYERNSAPTDRGIYLFSILFAVGRSSLGGATVTVLAEVDAALHDAEDLIAEHTAAVLDGVGTPPDDNGNMRVPANALAPEQAFGPGTRYKYKAGYLRKAYSPEQLRTIHSYLAQPEQAPYATALLFEGYGGRVNAVASDATATAQRDSILKAMYQTVWENEEDDAAALDFTRRLYRDVYAATGGVPVPDETNDGSYINYPDVDLADPEWNTSGVPWTDLYYRGNYPRLQQVKAAYDPRNVFHHALSIRLPGA